MRMCIWVQVGRDKSNTKNTTTSGQSTRKTGMWQVEREESDSWWTNGVNYQKVAVWMDGVEDAHVAFEVKE